MPEALTGAMRRKPTTPPPPGSTRLYEDPDIDEYEGYDDVGYWRREVPRQDEFIALHLERGTVRRAAHAALCIWLPQLAICSRARVMKLARGGHLTAAVHVVVTTRPPPLT